MRISTLKERLSSRDAILVRKSLEYLEKRSGDFELLNEVEYELEKVATYPDPIGFRAQSLLCFQTMKNFISFYQVKPTFYDSVEDAISKIVEDILDKKPDARIEDIPMKIRRFLYRIGRDEIRFGTHLADYVGYHVKNQLKKPDFLGGFYSEIIEGLISYGIIDRNKSYCSTPPYNKTRGYRISRKWLKQNYKRRLEFESSFILERTEEIIQNVTLDYETAMNQLENYLNEDLIKDKITVLDKNPLIHDDKIAKIYLMKKQPDGCRQLKPYYKLPMERLNSKYDNPLYILDDKLIGCSLSSYLKWKIPHVGNSYTRQIVSLVNKEGNLVYGSDGRRIYSTISSLPKILLSQVHLNGDTFIEKDLSNSQWRFLMYCLYNPQLDNIVSIYVRLFGNEFINKPDFIEIQDAIYRGKFYEHIQSKIYEDILISHFFYGQPINQLAEKRQKELKRKATKMITFLILFSSHEYDPEVKQEFRRVFPTLSKICDDLKNPEFYNYIYPVWRQENQQYFKDHYEGKGPTDDEVYKELPIELQRVESNIMINKVLFNLYQNDINALSKHDAFLIPSQEYDKGYSIIKDTLDSIFGELTYNLK